jgi:hypothetical protein
MKTVTIILAAIFTFNGLYANDAKKPIDDKLIKEVQAELSEVDYHFNSIIEQPAILIYDMNGKLLHSFSKENIDPIAMRNADLLMEVDDQKIFVKMKELNPSI